MSDELGKPTDWRDGIFDVTIEEGDRGEFTITYEDSIIFDIYDDGSNSICENCIYDNFHEFGSDCCDSAWEDLGYTCAQLELMQWNCSGCSCPGDEILFCGDGICSLYEVGETASNCPADCSHIEARSSD